MNDHQKNRFGQQIVETMFDTTPRGRERRERGERGDRERRGEEENPETINPISNPKP